MTIQQKLVTVFGGTGNQGSAVVRSLLQNHGQAFKVRVITRDSSSAKALAVAELGAELVQAENLNRGEMVAAFENSWGAFINSNSDDHSVADDIDAPNFYDLDVAVLDAAEAAGVQHVIYSSAGNSHRATKGRIHIPGFECKAYAEDYAREHKQFTTFTTVMPASFMECWLDESFCRTFGGFPFFPDAADGPRTLRMPPYGGDGRMPWVSLQHDFGDIVHGIFVDPQRYNGQRVQAISEMLTFDELASSFTAATGIKSQYIPMTSWADIPRDGTHCRDESRRIFFMMNFCGGKWFSEYASDPAQAIACKKAGKTARGVDDAEDLITFKEFFKQAKSGI